MWKIFKDKLFYIYSLIVILFFGILIKPEYALDTFFVMEHQVSQTIASFSQGRFVKGLFYLIFLNKGFSFEKVYLVSYIIAIVSSILSLYILNNIIKKDIKNRFLVFIITLLIIINPFSIELMMFFEKGVMWIGILSSVLTLKMFIEYIDDKRMIKLLLAMSFMLISIFSYQGVSALFIALATVYILKKSKTFKEFIMNNIYMGIIYVVPAIINVIIVRFIFVNGRVNGHVVFLESLKMIYERIPSMLDAFYILPKYVFIIVISIVFLLCIVLIIKYSTNKVIKILGILYIIIATLLATLAPQLLQNTKSVWLVARSTYAFGSIAGIMLLYMFINTNLKISIKTHKVIIIFSILFLLVQLYSYMDIEVNRYIVNYKDKENALMIGELITHYEEETGKKVEKISFASDSYPTQKYPNIKAIKDGNLSTFGFGWTLRDTIGYYTGIRLKNKNPSKEIQEICAGKDYYTFDIDNVIIENNTINICGF